MRALCADCVQGPLAWYAPTVASKRAPTPSPARTSRTKGAATASDFERIAGSLDGTTTARHFDRTAFRVARIYATLPRDGETANLLFTRLDQEAFCERFPRGFAPVPGGWGRMGYTTVTFAAVTPAQLEEALRRAWSNAQPRPRNPRAQRRAARDVGP